MLSLRKSLATDLKVQGLPIIATHTAPISGLRGQRPPRTASQSPSVSPQRQLVILLSILRWFEMYLGRSLQLGKNGTKKQKSHHSAHTDHDRDLKQMLSQEAATANRLFRLFCMPSCKFAKWRTFPNDLCNKNRYED